MVWANRKLYVGALIGWSDVDNVADQFLVDSQQVAVDWCIEHCARQVTHVQSDVIRCSDDAGDPVTYGISITLDVVALEQSEQWLLKQTFLYAIGPRAVVLTNTNLI